MKKIKTVLVDDENPNVKLMHSMLGRHCPEVEVVGYANDADEAFKVITELEPDLVFLDIKMPGKTGFDLLRMFNSITFQVVFVTGFDQYAIQAFEFNAMDYILKPIDHSKLEKAVEKMQNRIGPDDSVVHFVRSLDEKTHLIRSISLHHNERVHVIDINDICYINAMRGYSEIVTVSGQKLVSSKTLSDYEELLSPFSNFLRVNKSVLINIDYVTGYTKGVVCFITLKHNDEPIEVSRRRKTDIIKYLRKRE